MVAAGKSSDFGDNVFQPTQLLGAGLQRLPLAAPLPPQIKRCDIACEMDYASNMSDPLSDHASASFSCLHQAAPYMDDELL